MAKGRSAVARPGVVRPAVDPKTYARAARLRRKLTGAAFVAKDQGLPPELMNVREVLTEFAYGRIWARDDLNMRERVLLNIGVMMALNRPHELGVNLRMGLENGLSRRDAAGAILHAAAFCGIPSGVGAIAVARKVFEELESADAAPRPAKRRTRRAAK